MKKIEKIKIKDKSGDKEFFTIIPNYVLNHSSHWDREVYIQMKKIAGENGKCFMSIKRLMKQCGISKGRLNTSIDYLIKHKWINYVGKTKYQTRGGEQYINTYTINNLWKLNAEFYKGGSSEDHPTPKGGSPNDPKGGHQIAKGGSPDDHKEYLINNINNNNIKQKTKKFIKMVNETLRGIKFDENYKKIIGEFILYWTEPTKSGKQIRYDKEATWDTKRRLRTWIKNAEKFGGLNNNKRRII